MLDMLKRHEIQVLRRAGHNATEIARLTGVSRRSVRRVEAEAPVEQIDKRVEIKKRRLGRPSRAEPFRLFVVDLLESEPELLSLEVFRRAKLAGYAGRKSALYELIRSVRQKKPKPMVRFEGCPGNSRSTTSARSTSGSSTGPRSASTSSLRGPARPVRSAAAGPDTTVPLRQGSIEVYSYVASLRRYPDQPEAGHQHMNCGTHL